MIGGARSIASAGRKLRGISVTACVIVFAGSVADGNRGDSLVATMVDDPHWLVRSDCWACCQCNLRLRHLGFQLRAVAPLRARHFAGLSVGYGRGPWPGE